MSARDELADIMFNEYKRNVGPVTVEQVAAAVLAAGYSKPRTITTVEELDALPLESVVMDAEKYIYEKSTGTPAGSEWDMPGVMDPLVTTEITLPATVLHEPKSA